MTGHRTCIICLPRSGSQLCEKLVAEANRAGQLGEYFENWNQTEYFLDSAKWLHLKKISEQLSPYMIKKDYKEYISLLKQTNLRQSLVLRLFLIDYYDKDVLLEIITNLKNLGFEFIALHRNLKDQILSWMIAHSYRVIKDRDVFSINKLVDEPVNIDIKLLSNILDILVTSSKNWEDNLSIILKNVDYTKIKYENIYNDMENYFNIKLNYNGVKSINGDPLDFILNKEEVVDFLTSRGIS